MAIFYDKTAGIRTLQDKFHYIKNHFRYYTLNSWNGLRSIANKVKIYFMGLSKEQIDKAYNFLNVDGFYSILNDEIRELEWEYNIKIGFNGRSGGYLVLYNANDNGSAINEDLFEYDSYKEFKQSLKDIYSYDRVCDYANSEVNNAFGEIRLFDKVTDILRAKFIEILDTYQIAKKTILIEKEITELQLVIL